MKNVLSRRDVLGAVATGAALSLVEGRALASAAAADAPATATSAKESKPGLMDIVDTQVHLNQLGTLEAGLTAMDAMGVASLLYDESSGYDEKGRTLPGHALVNGAFRQLSPLAEAAAYAHPDRIGVLRRVEHRDPELSSLMKTMAEAPYVKAVRIALLQPNEIDDFAAGKFGELFSVAAQHDLPLVILSPGRPELIAPYAQKFPSVRMVVDHCGAALKRSGPTGLLDSALSLARFKNVSFKWAHAPFMFSQQGFPFDDVIPLLRRVLDAYGPERVMWGSDFTLTQKLYSWAESLFYIREADGLSDGDKEWVLGRTARTVLNWPAGQKDTKRSA